MTHLQTEVSIAPIPFDVVAKVGGIERRTGYRKKRETSNDKQATIANEN